MRRSSMFGLLVAIVALHAAPSTARAATAVEIPVEATRADVQAAIDAAPAGATIRFADGIHALGPGPEILIAKPLRLRSATHGRAVLVGNIGANGRPDPSTATNRCFHFAGAGTVDVHELTFEGFRQAVQVDGLLNTDIEVVDCQAHNCAQAFNVFVPPANPDTRVRIHGNDVDGTEEPIAVRAQGRTPVVPADYAIGAVQVTGNRLTAPPVAPKPVLVGLMGILVVNNAAAHVRDNYIEGFTGIFGNLPALGIQARYILGAAAEGATIADNVIVGCTGAVEVESEGATPATLTTLSGLKIRDNLIAGADLGVSLAFGANHAVVRDNHFDDNRLADVILFGNPPLPPGYVLDPQGILHGPPGGDTTRANKVVVDDAALVLDFGNDPNQPNIVRVR